MRESVKARCVVVALALIASGSPALCQSDSRDADLQLMQRYKQASASCDQASKYLAKKDYDRAEKELGKSVERMPELSQARFLLAKVLYQKKSFIEALEQMELATRHFPVTAKLVARMQEDRLSILRQRQDELLSLIASLQGQLQGASGQQQQILQNRLAEAERTRNQIEQELNAIVVNPDKPPAEYMFFHGNILLRLQRYSEAAAQYTAALQADPGYADAVNNLASLYHSAKQNEKALEILEQAEARGVVVNPELKKAVLAAMGR